jgi:PAT family beta-lactamase induction signal transducer AmpG
MTETTPKKRNTGVWVSILYFAEGFPYTVVNLMSAIFLKDFGASNELIGLTSFLYLPWTLKGLWGPVVDLYSTKRQWILTTEIVCIFLFAVLALGALTPQVVAASIFILAAIAFVSATHDIAIDGFYLDALNNEQQAFYVGWRSTAYKIAWLVGSGGLVFLAGTIKPLKFGWAAAFGLSAVIFILVYCFQLWYLPHSTTRDRHSQAAAQNEEGNLPQHHFLEAFKSYFTQYKIGWIVTYVLIFRLGDAFLLKIAPLFLKDPFDKGGLNISTAEMGILYGTVGVIFLLIGGILGGYLVAKQGLKKWMWPTAILQYATNPLYWLLSVYQPGVEWAYLVNSFEQFSYGLGVSAYTVFLMRTVRPEYKASHYAITTAFMAAGVLIPGIFSGYLQSWLGYPHYFLISCLLSLPGLATIFFLPLEEVSRKPVS